MAKDLSKYQQGIVNRYYEHQDTIQSNKLSDLVSELWLAEDEKTKVKLWGKAQIALMRMGVDANRVAAVVGQRDMEALARLVQQADAGKAYGQNREQIRGQNRPQGPDQSLSRPTHRNAVSASDGRTLRDLRSQQQAATGRDSLDEENLKRALREFRKKLKALRRDDESKLAGRYTTKGQTSAITAITPPNEYPAAVWNKLVELGRLRKDRQGLYELTDGG